MITEILNFIFLPVLADFGRQWFVLFIAVSLTILTALLHKQLTPQKKVKKIRKEIARLAADLKNHLGNGEIFSSLNQQLMDKKMKLASYTILPTIAIIIPMFMIFPWMSRTVPGEVIHIFGLGIGWLITYIAISLITGGFVRKALGA